MISDPQQIDSPDQRYAIRLVSTEMRMSHWVTSAALWESDPPRLLLQIGDGLWSSEEIAWSADSRIVTVGLRRYPGDAPGTRERGNVLEAFRTRGVRDLTGVSDYERRRFEPPFDADEQRTRRPTPAEAHLGDALIVDVGT